MVVFDLDFCLWSPEMYELSGAPFQKHPDGTVTDRRGQEVTLFPGAKAALVELATDPRWSETLVGYASRTDQPEWAEECLSLIDVVDGVSMRAMARCFEIGGGDGPAGCKTQKFQRLQSQTGIPFEQMLFFDDGMYNCRDVGPLGDRHRVES